MTYYYHSYAQVSWLFSDAYIWTDVGVNQLPRTNSPFMHDSLGLFNLAFDKVNLYKIIFVNRLLL